jgi:3',5'-cyclic AMP phosphodiesterase CpdA
MTAVTPSIEQRPHGTSSSVRHLLHISDIHFGPPHRADIAAGVIELARARRPDLVIISGDLTIRAKPDQFRDARQFIDRLEQDVGVPTISVPGNHDVPLYRVWERAFAPFAAYRRHFSPDLEPEFEDDELLVIGINTAHGWTEKDGRITRRRLAAVQARLARAKPGQTRLIVLHHELAPAPRFDALRVLAGAHEAAELFAQSGVEMTFAGHLHQGFLAASDAYYPSQHPAVLFLHAGTTTSTRGRGSEVDRNSCNWVTIEDQAIVWTHLGWHELRACFVPWSEHRYPRQPRRLDGLLGTTLPTRP